MEESIIKWTIGTHLSSVGGEFTFSLTLTYSDEEGHEREIGPCRIDEKQLIDLKADIDRLLGLFAEHR